MTPDELHALADAATENWRVEPGQSQYLFVGGLHRFRTLMRSDADARLAALAPDLALLCAAADPLMQHLTPIRYFTGWSNARNGALNWLASLADLEAR